MRDRQDKMRMELRRGVLVMAVLATLREERYAYSLRLKLMEINIDIEEGTLYPLVRRLESQNLLNSEWRESQGRRKRYYKTSPEGEALLHELIHDWSALNNSLKELLEDGK